MMATRSRCGGCDYGRASYPVGVAPLIRTHSHKKRSHLPGESLRVLEVFRNPRHAYACRSSVSYLMPKTDYAVDALPYSPLCESIDSASHFFVEPSYKRQYIVHFRILKAIDISANVLQHTLICSSPRVFNKKASARSLQIPRCPDCHELSHSCLILVREIRARTLRQSNRRFQALTILQAHLTRLVLTACEVDPHHHPLLVSGTTRKQLPFTQSLQQSFVRRP